VALREAILKRPEAFVTTVTERLLTYALGRGLEPSDMPVVRRIVRNAAGGDYRLASIITGIVNSVPFQMRTTLEPADTANRGSEGAVAMFITKKHLSRRTFLQGTFGAAVALPFLDAMVPALTAQTRSAVATPFRFGAIYMPNGVFPDTWHPDEVGAGFTFKPVMQPLEPFRKELVTISGMKAPWGESVHVGASARSSTASDRSPRGIRPVMPSARSSRRRPSISSSPITSPAMRRCDRSKSAPRTWARRPAHATASRARSSTRSPGATM
jgi:hypothetical protein